MRNAVGIVVGLAFTAGWLGAASITVNVPYPGHTYEKKSTVDIQWANEGTLPENVKITLRNETSTTEVLGIADPVPTNTGTYGWFIPPSLANGKYVVRVKAKGVDIYDDSGVFTVIDAPNVTITSPQEGAVWELSSAHVISWTTKGNMADTARIYLVGSDHKFTYLTENTPSPGVFSWKVEGFKVGTYDLCVSVRVLDILGEDTLGTTYATHKTIKIVPPKPKNNTPVKK